MKVPGARQLHTVFSWLDRVKAWQLVLAFLAILAFSIWALRQNSLTMNRLRNEVLLADEVNGDVEGSLNRLKNHIFSHMNTDMGQPLELIHSYNRAVDAVRQAIAASSVTNQALFEEAEAACRRQGTPQAVLNQCFQDYVLSHAPEGYNPQAERFPPKELFVYSFASPAWTPDLAGLSLVLAGFLLLAILERTLGTRLAHLKLEG